MTDPKPEKIVSKKYLAFVKSLPCLICGVRPVDADHLKSRGWGEAKRVDYFCIPLCRLHHSERGQIGDQKFCEKYRVDPWRECSRIIVAFFLGVPIEEI